MKPGTEGLLLLFPAFPWFLILPSFLPSASSYDATGRRVLKTVGSAKTRYIYDGWQCIEEYLAPTAASGFIDAPNRQYVNGNNMDEALQYKYRAMTDPADVYAINTQTATVTVVGEYDEDTLNGHDIVLWDSDTGARIYSIADNAEHSGGNTAITVTSGTGLGDFTVANTDYVILYQPAAYYYHANVQGNTVAITDANGNIKEEVTYDVYGRLTSVKVDGTPLTQTNGLVTVGTYFAGSLTKNARLFQGRDLDEESGLYYFRNRQYDPVHGRFLTRDLLLIPSIVAFLASLNDPPPCPPCSPW